MGEELPKDLRLQGGIYIDLFGTGNLPNQSKLIKARFKPVYICLLVGFESVSPAVFKIILVDSAADFLMSVGVFVKKQCEQEQVKWRLIINFTKNLHTVAYASLRRGEKKT